jgi:hypothetical protein
MVYITYKRRISALAKHTHGLIFEFFPARGWRSPFVLCMIDEYS